MKKKLLICYHSSNYGGVEKHILDLVKCVSKDLDCTVACPDGPLVKEYVKAGAGHLNLYPRSELDIRYVRLLVNHIHRSNIDIVHAHELKTGVLAIISAYIAKVPKRIYHVHTPFIFWKHSVTKKYFALVINTLVNVVVGNFLATDVIALTEYIAKIRRENEFILKKKIRIIPNGVELAEFKRSESLRKRFRRKLRLKENDILVSYLSRFTEEKGHKDLIYAIHKLLSSRNSLGIKFMLAGSKGSQLDSMKEVVKKLGLGQYIEFMVDISDDTRYAIYNSSDLFVMPSHAEGFGIVMIEAMASKLCILASDLPVLKDVGKDAVCYFRVENIEDLAKKLEMLVDDPRLRENYSKKSFDRAKVYSMSNFCKAYHKLYLA